MVKLGDPSIIKCVSKQYDDVKACIVVNSQGVPQVLWRGLNLEDGRLRPIVKRNGCGVEIKHVNLVDIGGWICQLTLHPFNETIVEETRFHLILEKRNISLESVKGKIRTHHQVKDRNLKNEILVIENSTHLDVKEDSNGGEFQRSSILNIIFILNVLFLNILLELY